MRLSSSLLLSIPLSLGLAACTTGPKDGGDTDAFTDDPVTDTDGPADTDLLPADTDVVDTDPVDTDVLDTDLTETAVEDDTDDTDLVADTDTADSGPVDTDDTGTADTDLADTDPSDTDVVVDTDDTGDTSDTFHDTFPIFDDTFDTSAPVDTGAADTDPLDTDGNGTDTGPTGGDTDDTDVVTACPADAYEPGPNTYDLAIAPVEITEATVSTGAPDVLYIRVPATCLATVYWTNDADPATSLSTLDAVVVSPFPIDVLSGPFAGTVEQSFPSPGFDLLLQVTIDAGTAGECVDYNLRVVCDTPADTGDSATGGDTYDTSVLDTADTAVVEACPVDAYEPDDEVSPIEIPLSPTTYSHRTVIAGESDAYLWHADPGCGMNIGWTANLDGVGSQLDVYAPALGDGALFSRTLGATDSFDIPALASPVDLVVVVTQVGSPVCVTYDISFETYCASDTDVADTDVADTDVVPACAVDAYEPDDVVPFPLDLSTGMARVSGRTVTGTDSDNLVFEVPANCSPTLLLHSDNAAPGLATFAVTVLEMGTTPVDSGTLFGDTLRPFPAPPFPIHVQFNVDGGGEPACLTYSVDVYRGCAGDPPAPPAP